MRLHTFNQVKVEINEDTKLAIQNFAKLKNKKAVQSFLKNLSEMIKSLEKIY